MDYSITSKAVGCQENGNKTEKRKRGSSKCECLLPAYFVEEKHWITFLHVRHSAGISEDFWRWFKYPR
jgi:hypothetical protein